MYVRELYADPFEYFVSVETARKLREAGAWPNAKKNSRNSMRLTILRIVPAFCLNDN